MTETVYEIALDPKHAAGDAGGIDRDGSADPTTHSTSDISRSGDRKAFSPAVSWLIRLSVTAAVLGVMASMLDSQQVAIAISRLDLRWAAASFLLIISTRILSSLRWQTILAAHGIISSLPELIRITFVSMFFGTLLPTSLAADVVRGIQFSKRHGRVSDVTATLIIDRFIGIYVHVLFALLGALVLMNSQLIALFSTLFCTITLAWLVGRSILNASRSFFNQRSGRIVLKLLALTEALTNTSLLARIAPRVSWLTVMVILVRCGIFYCLFKAFGAHVDFIYFFVFVPILFIIVLLPISLGGLGVREASLAYFFGTLGIASEISVGVGLMFHFFQLLASSLGAVGWLKHRQTSELKSS